LWNRSVFRPWKARRFSVMVGVVVMGILLEGSGEGKRFGIGLEGDPHGAVRFQEAPILDPGDAPEQH